MSSGESFEKTRSVWIVLADCGRARMLRCERTEYDGCHIEELDVLRVVTPPLNRSVSGPIWKNRLRTFGIEDNSDRKALARSAQRIAQWIEKKSGSLAIRRLVLISPARFLGAMREYLPPGLRQRIVERNSELVHLSSSLLSKHPTIRELVGIPTEKG